MHNNTYKKLFMQSVILGFLPVASKVWIKENRLGAEARNWEEPAKK